MKETTKHRIRVDDRWYEFTLTRVGNFAYAVDAPGVDRFEAASLANARDVLRGVYENPS